MQKLIIISFTWICSSSYSKQINHNVTIFVLDSAWKREHRWDFWKVARRIFLRNTKYVSYAHDILLAKSKNIEMTEKYVGTWKKFMGLARIRNRGEWEKEWKRENRENGMSLGNRSAEYTPWKYRINNKFLVRFFADKISRSSSCCDARTINEIKNISNSNKTTLSVYKRYYFPAHGKKPKRYRPRIYVTFSRFLCTQFLSKSYDRFYFAAFWRVYETHLYKIIVWLARHINKSCIVGTYCKYKINTIFQHSWLFNSLQKYRIKSFPKTL